MEYGKKLNETKNSFEKWSEKYDRSILIPLFYKRVHKKIIDFIGDVNGKRILDIGCGTGNFLMDLHAKNSGSYCIGIDLSPKMIDVAIRKASGKKGIEFLVGESSHLPFDKKHFDFIVSTFSFHHWPNQESALDGIYKSLNPSGKFIITDVNFFGGPGTNKIVRPKKMRNLLSATGFDNVYHVPSVDSGIYGFSAVAVGSALAAYNISQLPEFSWLRTAMATSLIAGGIIYSIPSWMSKITVGEK